MIHQLLTLSDCFQLLLNSNRMWSMIIHFYCVNDHVAQK